MKHAIEIVYLDAASLPHYAQLAKPNFAHRWLSYQQTSVEQIVERSLNASILVVNKVPMSAATLRQLPKLRLIAVPATGTDNIDLDYCQQRQIAVRNVRNYATQTVAEHTLMLMLMLLRRVNAYQNDVQQGKWQRSNSFCLHQHRLADLADKQVLLLGRGAIGQRVAQLCQAFGARVAFADLPAYVAGRVCRNGYVDLTEAMTTADIVSLHCPLNAENRAFIDAQLLALVKPDCVLINTARGALLNEIDVAAALLGGKIAGLAVDVLATEPMQVDNPLQAVLHLDNVIITPHCSWLGEQALQTLCQQTIAHINQFVKEELL